MVLLEGVKILGVPYRRPTMFFKSNQIVYSDNTVHIKSKKRGYRGTDRSTNKHIYTIKKKKKNCKKLVNT